MERAAIIVTTGIIGVVTTLLIGLFSTLPIFLIWNDVMPTLFGLKSISFWQAVELSLLCSFLFKSSSSIN